MAVSDELSTVVILQKDTTLRKRANRIFITLQKNNPAISRVYPYFDVIESVCY